MKTFLGALALSGVLACGGSDTAPASDDGALGGSGGTGSTTVAGSAGSSGASGSAASGGSGTGGSGPSATTFTLTLAVTEGGRVTSTPPGIDCGSTCTATFPAGTEVQLASNEEGGVLTGWGGPCSGTAACSLTLDADEQVSASFAPFEVGANAHGVAVLPDGAHALVTLGDSAGTLKLVSLSDGAITDSIGVGSFPGAVAVTPDGTRAVVNNLSTMSVVTLSTKAVATVPSPCSADTLYDVAITPDGTHAVTTMFQGNCVTNSVAVIALDTASIENQYAIPAQLSSGIAVAADGASALVGLGILGTKVSRVALTGGAITDISDTSSSFGIAVRPDGSEALVASGDGDTIKRIALASNSVTGSIEYASNQDPHNLAISPDGKLVVAVGSFDVGLLSLESGTVLKTFSGGGRSVAITPDGNRALVTLGSKLRVFSLRR